MATKAEVLQGRSTRGKAHAPVSIDPTDDLGMIVIKSNSKIVLIIRRNHASPEAEAVKSEPER